MTNPWFRMYSEFATDPKVQMMSEAFQRRFIMVLCLRCSNENVTLHDEEVAFQLRISNEEWAETKACFVAKNLLNEDNTPVSWDKRQFRSDSSAERVARHRANKKKQPCNDSNVTETPPDTESEADTESENPEVEHTVSESEPHQGDSTAESPPVFPTTQAGEVCRAIKAEGIPTANPSHPTLIALLNAGASADEFRFAAREAKAKGKADFAYVIGTVRKRREEAAALVLHKGRMPITQIGSGRQARIDNYAAQAAAARGEHANEHGSGGTERDITGESVRIA